MPLGCPDIEVWELPSEKLLFEAWEILHAIEEAGEHSSERNIEAERKQGVSVAALRLNVFPTRWPNNVELLTSCFLQKAPYPFSAELLTRPVGPIFPWKRNKKRNQIHTSDQLPPSKCQGMSLTQQYRKDWELFLTWMYLTFIYIKTKTVGKKGRKPKPK